MQRPQRQRASKTLDRIAMNLVPAKNALKLVAFDVCERFPRVHTADDAHTTLWEAIDTMDRTLDRLQEVAAIFRSGWYRPDA